LLDRRWTPWTDDLKTLIKSVVNPLTSPGFLTTLQLSEAVGSCGRVGEVLVTLLQCCPAVDLATDGLGQAMRCCGMCALHPRVGLGHCWSTVTSGGDQPSTMHSEA